MTLFAGGASVVLRKQDPKLVHQHVVGADAGVWTPLFDPGELLEGHPWIQQHAIHLVLSRVARFLRRQ